VSRPTEPTRFVTGRGSYLADRVPPGTAYAAFARSTVPHAELAAVDGGRALALPGVLRVLTGRDLATRTKPLSHLLPWPPARPLAWPLLATDRVRHVGEPVAAVVAEDPYTARDAADLVEIGYRELPAALDVDQAMAPGAPLLYPEWGDNVFLSARIDHGDVDAAFRAADLVLDETFTHHRICGFPLEGRGVLASVDGAGGRDRLLVRASTQVPHVLRMVIAGALGLAEHAVRVTVPDIGGGFGFKQHVTREEVTVAYLGLVSGRPVLWTEDVDAGLLAGSHAREQRHEVRVALRADGRILGLRVRVVADIGHPVLYHTGAGPALITGASIPGAYHVPAYSCRVDAVATNTPPVGGYRGYGQPQAVFTMERVLDLAARDLGLQPARIRELNLVPDEPRPYVSCTGARYDVGSVRALFGRARQLAGSLDASGLGVGVGYACFVEATAPNLFGLLGVGGAVELVQLRMTTGGELEVCTGITDFGQGSTAAVARIAAAALPIDPGKVHVRNGDSDDLPFSLGAVASRGTVMASGAIHDAVAALRRTLAAIAAAQLGVLASEVEFGAGGCRGGGRLVSYAELAGIAYHRPFLLPPGVAPGLVVTGSYTAAGAEPFPGADGRMNAAATYSAQAAAARVRVDAASGEVDVLNFAVVYDCGSVVDEARLLGQLQGGFGQGLSATLFERLDRVDGALVPASLAGYPVARAGHVPAVHAESMATASAVPGGVRGAGQLTTVLAPAAIANAVEDALRAHGVRIRDSYLGPSAIRRLVATG